MIKFCKIQWDNNKDRLKQVLEERTDLNACDYGDLVKLVVKHIFNPGYTELMRFPMGKGFNEDAIHEIDDGDYQGTMLYLIPLNTYQPSEYDYLMTFVGYGSCSGCDTLQAIQEYTKDSLTTEQINDFMSLCKDIVMNTICPYNTGWRGNDLFAEVSIDD